MFKAYFCAGFTTRAKSGFGFGPATAACLPGVEVEKSSLGLGFRVWSMFCSTYIGVVRG